MILFFNLSDSCKVMKQIGAMKKSGFTGSYFKVEPMYLQLQVITEFLSFSYSLYVCLWVRWTSRWMKIIQMMIFCGLDEPQVWIHSKPILK